MNILVEQLRADRQKQNYALVTVIRADGSTPRHSGSKMLVFSDGRILGTIGGGAIEKRAIEDAVECIKNNANAFNDYTLTTDQQLGMACGGDMSVFIEVYCHKPQLVMCGAGHVGGALIKLAQMLNFEVTLVDTRAPELIQDKIDMADKFVPCETFESGIENLDVGDGAFYVIATFGHAPDGEALGAALKKNGAYVGMIGSHSKIGIQYDKLRAKGVSEETLATVYSPIGLDIGTETPEEIALAIMAEIFQVKSGRTGKHLKDLTSK